MPPTPGCPRAGPPSPEVTEAFCRVPSTSFSQAPGYALSVHLCRFRVRSIRRGCFPGPLRRTDNPISPHNHHDPSLPARPRNVDLVPIAYGFRPRLRGRLTLGGLALPRNPWTYGVSVSHTHLVTHVSIRSSDTSSSPREPPSQAYGTLRYRIRNQGSGIRDQKIPAPALKDPATSSRSPGRSRSNLARSLPQSDSGPSNNGTRPASRRPSQSPS